MFLNTDIVLLGRFATTTSLFPSPSKSPMDIPQGSLPVAKSTLVANELLVILPVVLVFLNSEIVLLLKFVTTTSLFPSPSISPIETPYGALPVAKSTFGANELLVKLPDELVFLNTDIVLLL